LQRVGVAQRKTDCQIKVAGGVEISHSGQFCDNCRHMPRQYLKFFIVSRSNLQQRKTTEQKSGGNPKFSRCQDINALDDPGGCS
jgi:hypothetical protein